MKLFDTNILVYAYNTYEAEKRKKCLPLVESVFNGETKGQITNQILGELFHVLAENMKNPFNSEEAKKIVDSFITSNNWDKFNYDYKTVKKATTYVKDYKIHFWDALIVATMVENNISSIYTENEKDFKKIPGINVINPFLMKDENTKTKVLETDE